MANVSNVNVDKIKALAKAQGLSMKYLCDCIGKHRGFLSCVRNGTDRIDEKELEIVAGIIHTNVDYLTDKTDCPEPYPEETTKNLLRLAGRDGNYVERALSDEQLKMLRALIDQLPEAPEDL